MRNKRIAVLAVALSLVLVLAIVGIALSGRDMGLTIVDADGNTLAVLTELSVESAQVSDEACRAYLDVVLSEAVQVIAETENCSEARAERRLMHNGYTLETAFEATALQACKSAYEAFNDSATPFAAVVTALDGRVLCVFSGSADDVNYAAEKTQPYSVFKPISVYAPALESGKASWSSVYMDAPVKQVEDENGELTDWPSNSDGQYSYENVSVCEGIKFSLNTTAVRCLMDVGVMNSINFMQQHFDIDFTHEQRVASTMGEEEVLANIGLGYLNAGVSPLDMAGFYQIFATGGKYEEPYSILRITQEDGATYYTHSDAEKQVLTEETAYIMNRLLQNTLTSGGTAEKAQVDGLTIGGKTGTGSGHVGNWFVGFTPEYSCSIWHGKSNENRCAELFPALMADLEHDASKTFPECTSVVQQPYCVDSGKRLTMQCSRMEIGYYPASYSLEKCDMHSE